MKQNDIFLKSTTILAVTLLHAGAIALAWQDSKPPELIVADNLTVVDIAALLGDGDTQQDDAPAPLGQITPPPAPQPQPEKTKPPVEKVVQPEPPKPATPPKIAAVVRHDKPADIKQPEKAVAEPPKSPPPSVQAPKAEPSKPSAPPSQSKSPSSQSSNLVQGDTKGNPNSNSNSDAKGNPNGSPNGDEKSRQTNLSSEKRPPHKPSIQDGGYKNIPMPPYPDRAANNGEEGRVVLSILVNPNKSIGEIKVIKSSGSADLDNAAKKAARNASYDVIYVDGQPAPSRFTTSFNFKL